MPALDFCVRCGDPLAAELQAARAGGGVNPVGRRSQFAAQSDEHALVPHVLSTLFPQLPRADMATFRLALAIGLAVLVGLAFFGLYPLALVAAELLVPMLMVLYLWDVDVYEDEPLRVLALTAAVGIVAGVLVGLAIGLLPETGTLLGRPTMSTLAIHGIAIPLIGGACMLAGPLVLLPHRKFNDVLDGATFGATSAVAFTAAQGLASAIDFFGNGLQPGGDPVTWIVRLLSLGIAMPLIAAGSIGGATGAFWLRYRAPLRDRHRMWLLGEPIPATALAAVMLIAAALGQELLPFLPALIWLAILAFVALLWLRVMIHIGLLEEADEIDIGPPTRCPNCRRMTPSHSFCGHCGNSLRAAPKAGPAAPTDTAAPAAPSAPAPAGEDAT